MRYCPPIVELFTDDPLLIEIANEYWAYNDETGMFKHTQKSLKDSYKNILADPVSKVAAVSRAHTKMDICACGNVTRYYNNRRMIERVVYEEEWLPVCDECQSKENQKHNEATKALMYQALRESRHHQLNRLEFSIFADFIRLSGDKETIRNRNGMNTISFDRLISHLQFLNLLGEEKPWGTLFYLDEYREICSNINENRTIKSFFGSPGNRDLYYKTKQKYPYVFPEVPVCCFIEKEEVKHLFTKHWHDEYFLKCRVDILVCTWDGIPEFVIENQGSKHEERGQKERDEFKKIIIESAGIMVNYCRVSANE